MKRPNYERDDKTFSADAYTADGWAQGIAWHVLGWETEPDSDTEWSGEEPRTGRVVAVMVGDDRRFTFETDDLHALEREDYCGSCGQIGCGHDGLDRSEERA
jgi:hypothetical protein